MPEGSSSDAPVMRPGPRIRRKRATAFGADFGGGQPATGDAAGFELRLGVMRCSAVGRALAQPSKAYADRQRPARGGTPFAVQGPIRPREPETGAMAQQVAT